MSLRVRVPVRSEYATVVCELGRELAARNLELVYGGAKVGLMGRLADSVLESGGRVVGVIPEGRGERDRASGTLGTADRCVDARAQGDHGRAG